jgi:signal transduction histidine kinase
MALNRIFAKLALILTLAIFMGNLSALTDLFLHPEIPYFDEEHLVVGGISALVTGIFAALLAIYIENLRQSRRTIQELNEELERKIVERTKQLQEAQDELVRKERLATLGQLAGTVGHELRNPLGVMSNAVYYLKSVLSGADESVTEYLMIIKQEIRNAERIIADLLDFSIPKIPQATITTAAPLIQRSLETCTIPGNVTLRLDVPDTTLEVKVDPLHIERVFRNLITNGIQAMPKGGVLLISARKLSGLPLHDFIEISFADSGEGIDPQNMAHLFQPLFTTKARGAGLGLIVSKKLVEANGGRIDVESHVGKGTTFTVILPGETSEQAARNLARSG